MSGVPEEIKRKAAALNQRGAQIHAKISEIDMDRAEHAYVFRFRVKSHSTTFRITLFFSHSYRNVLVTLKGTNKDRKCFQLVGDVLVEQTVADVLPKVEENEKGVSFLEGFRGSASSLLHIQSNAHTPTTQISMMKKKLGEQLELIKKQLVDLQVRSLCVWCYSYFFLFTPTPLFLSFAERVQGSFEANSSTAKWSRWCYGCDSVRNERWWYFGLVCVCV